MRSYEQGARHSDRVDCASEHPVWRPHAISDAILYGEIKTLQNIRLPFVVRGFRVPSVATAVSGSLLHGHMSILRVGAVSDTGALVCAKAIMSDEAGDRDCAGWSATASRGSSDRF